MLKFLNVPSSNTQLSTDNDILFDKAKTKIIFSLPNRENGNLLIPSTVEIISAGAFEECLTLLTVSVLPSSDECYGLKTIGFQAFYNCASLNFISIPLSVSFIGSNAFQGSGLSKCGSVVFPADLRDRLIETCVPSAALEPCPTPQFTDIVYSANVLLVASFALFEGE